MLANSKPLSLFKEGFRNRISIASLMRRLNVLLFSALWVRKYFIIIFWIMFPEQENNIFDWIIK